MSKHEYLYSPKMVWSYNTPEARRTHEPSHIVSSLWADHEVGDHITVHAGAPGYGKAVHRVTRKDNEGIHVVTIQNTIRIPHHG